MKKEILNKNLKNILTDKTSGSVELLIKLNQLIIKYSNEPEMINRIIKIIGSRLNDFQIITNYFEQVKKLNKYSNRSKLKFYLNTVLENISHHNEVIYEKAEKYLKGKNLILTLSNSKTIYEVLKTYSQKNKKLKIIICESRPKNEGRVLIKLFLKEDIKCELILDSMLPYFIENVDAVIIGADKILKDGNIINKIGSLNAAILCKHYRKPFYVLASKNKISNQTSFRRIQNNSDEVWKYSHKKLKINNFYFEEIDKKFITKIITN